MDDNIVPEAEHLAIVLRKLQEVFDVCDEDCDGWIRVEHFVDLGSQFGRGEEVKRLAKQLDPHSNGRINFKDFCHGVLAINGYEQNLQFLPGAEWMTHRQYMVDINPINQIHFPECLATACAISKRLKTMHSVSHP